jgi:hypothetical protein
MNTTKFIIKAPISCILANRRRKGGGIICFLVTIGTLSNPGAYRVSTGTSYPSKGVVKQIRHITKGFFHSLLLKPVSYEFKDEPCIVSFLVVQHRDNIKLNSRKGQLGPGKQTIRKIWREFIFYSILDITLFG